MGGKGDPGGPWEPGGGSAAESKARGGPEVAGRGAGDRALAAGGPLHREAEREVPAQRPPPLPVSGGWAVGRAGVCAEGAEGSSRRWGGVGAQGQILRYFQAFVEATFTCVGTRLAGGVGRPGRPRSASLKPKRASRQKGQEPHLSPIACDSSFPVGVCPADPEAKRPKKRRRYRVVRGTRVQEAPPLPQPKSPGGHSIWGCPGGEEGPHPRLPGAGLVLPAFQEPEGN